MDKKVTRHEWAINVIALSLLYYGIINNLQSQNNITATILAWFAGMWSTLSFILFLEDRFELKKGKK